VTLLINSATLIPVEQQPRTITEPTVEPVATQSIVATFRGKVPEVKEITYKELKPYLVDFSQVGVLTLSFSRPIIIPSPFETFYKDAINFTFGNKTGNDTG